MTAAAARLSGRVRLGEVELLVGDGVFCPQPETLDVARWIVANIPAASTVVDLCAGGGTLGLLVAAGLPGARVHAVELSPEAYAWLCRNVEHCAATNPGLDVVPHLGDAADALPSLDGAVDLVVSNPPYVATHELDGVDPAVRDHDPRVSLVAGHDGLDVVRVVTDRARDLLRPGGWLVVEHSDRQGETAPEVLRRRGFDDVTEHRDSEGRQRFAAGRKPG